MRVRFFIIILLAAGQTAFSAPLPGAGVQIQQIPPAPLPARSDPSYSSEDGTPPALAATDQNRVTIKGLHITGAHQFTESELIGASGFSGERTLSLAELRGMATRVAAWYHARGFFLAQAYLPAQEVADGVITIAVIEGQFGTLTLHNESSVSDALAHRLMAGLGNGAAVSTAPLETSLLLLSDLPGVRVQSTLRPGASVGASDLMVDLKPGARFDGSVDADNQGNRYTGANRLGATLNLNEPAGQGDVATVRVLSSGNGLAYARAAWQFQFDRTRIGAAWTGMHYRLGDEFASLAANGTATIASLYASQPLVRSRGRNLFLQFDYDAKTFHDQVDSTATTTDKRAQVAMLSLTGDEQDNVAGGGSSRGSLTWTDGVLAIGSADARAIDQATVHTNGHYDKLGFTAVRLQSLRAGTALYLAASGQLAARNLDVSEKMELGGANAVRAYPEGEAYADQGYVLNAELRQALPLAASVPGALQLVGFVDNGTVLFDKHVWQPTPNRSTLSGAGLGLDWSAAGTFEVKAYLAHKLGSATATSAPDASTRFWIQAFRFF